LAITDEEAALETEARHIIQQGFVTDAFVNDCAETLITKYMLLTPGDREQWEEDPEGWANSVDAENWEFELRVSGEKGTWAGDLILLLHIAMCGNDFYQLAVATP
jgi:hypothetical protein